MLIMSMSSEIMTHVPPSYVEGRSQKMALKLLEQKSIFYIEHEVRDPPERSAVRHCHFFPSEPTNLVVVGLSHLHCNK